MTNSQELGRQNQIATSQSQRSRINSQGGRRLNLQSNSENFKVLRDQNIRFVIRQAVKPNIEQHFNSSQGFSGKNKQKNFNSYNPAVGNSLNLGGGAKDQSLNFSQQRGLSESPQQKARKQSLRGKEAVKQSSISIPTNESAQYPEQYLL